MMTNREKQELAEKRRADAPYGLRDAMVTAKQIAKATKQQITSLTVENRARLARMTADRTALKSAAGIYGVLKDREKLVNLALRLLQSKSKADREKGFQIHDRLAGVKVHAVGHGDHLFKRGQ